MKKKNVLFINGVPDDKKVEVHTILKDGRIGWTTRGSANIADHIQNDLFNRSMVTFDTNPEQDIELNDIHAVFNHISDADTHKITLEKAKNFYNAVAGKIRFFNSPANIMKTTRDSIYQLLQDIDKLHIPKTVKIRPTSPSDVYDTLEKEGFKFPVIFRQAGDHGGISTIRIDDNTQQFHAFALDGREYYLTQFVEYADEDGMYVKYRLVVVDGEVFLRHTIFNDHWIIHSNSRKYMEKNQKYKRRERDTLNSFDTKIKPRIQPVIDEIYGKLELDYFGIDCHMDEHFSITVFEVNANMNVLINTAKSSINIWTQEIDTIKRAIVKMIIKDKI